MQGLRSINPNGYFYTPWHARLINLCTLQIDRWRVILKIPTHKRVRAYIVKSNRVLFFEPSILDRRFVDGLPTTWAVVFFSSIIAARLSCYYNFFLSPFPSLAHSSKNVDDTAFGLLNKRQYTCKKAKTHTHTYIPMIFCQYLLTKSSFVGYTIFVVVDKLIFDSLEMIMRGAFRDDIERYD